MNKSDILIALSFLVTVSCHSSTHIGCAEILRAQSSKLKGTCTATGRLEKIEHMDTAYILSRGARIGVDPLAVQEFQDDSTLRVTAKYSKSEKFLYLSNVLSIEQIGSDSE